MLQAGQAVQAQVQDRLRLFRRQVVAALAQPELARQILGAAGVRARLVEHRQHRAGLPGTRHQALARLGGAGRVADQLDHLVDIGQRDREALEHMAALARLAQQVDRAPRHHFAAVAQEGLEQFLQVQRARLAVDQRHHVDAEHALELGLGIEIVQHHLAGLAAAQLDHHAQAVLVRLVAQLRDALDALFLDQLGDLLDQPRLVQLVGDLGDDDGVATARVVGDHLGARPHVDAPAPGAVGLDDAQAAVDDAAGREVRARDDLDQVVDLERRVVDQRQAGPDHLAEVVRRDIGRHADRDARGAVDQQVRDARGQHRRDHLGAVVVRHEVHGFLVEVRQQLVRDLAHADLGVAHGRRRVAVDRAEVALPVDQHVAHGERLRHAHDRVVDRRVAVRVVLTDHVTHDARGLLVGLVPVVAQLAHREQDAPVHRLQAVAHIRQRPPHDHAHGVVEVGLAQFAFDADRYDFFC